MDALYELPYHARAAPALTATKIPAYEMIKFSVTILRGCFGGCSFCSITEHEGRIIQSRSEESILREIERIRDQTPGFTGIISDLGGPTANMYRLACKSREIEAACRKPSCVFPDICDNLGTDHAPLVALYRKARAIPGVKKIFIASGVRYDLAVRSPEWISELAQHHIGGYLKIAPEHTEDGPLEHMMKPGIGAYDRFKELFDRYSQGSGQGAVPDPVLHRRAPGHHRRGHAEPRAVAQAQRLPPRSGAGVPAVADGERDRDVPHRATTRCARSRRSERVHVVKGLERAPAPQGVPALSRSEQLADAARGAAPDGPRAI